MAFAARFARVLGVAGAASLGVALLPRSEPARASSEQLAPAEYPWSHKGMLQSFDHASIRRGFQVYKQVCSTCHSVELLAFRNLVDVAYTEKEAKEIAAGYEVVDVPDDEGETPMRPALLSDKIPRPYNNEQAARFANNGEFAKQYCFLLSILHSHYLLGF
jgi:ubiquinol-cytochrome c reductase cytochrome c1 subunit